jgi:DNA-binding transcriptional regulator YiaG
MIEALSIRLGYGLKRAQFARACSVTVQTVGNWDCGRTEPDPATLHALRLGLFGTVAPSGNLIRRARRIAHMKQRQAAALLGVAGRYWQDWESGRVPMPALKWALFLKLAKLPDPFTLDYNPLQSTKGLYR